MAPEPGALRVLFAAVRWPPETFLVRLVSGLLDAGLQVTVACAQKPGREWLQRSGFHWLPVPDTQRRFAGIFFPWGIGILKSLLKDPSAFTVGWKRLSRPPGSQPRRFYWPQTAPFAGKNWDVIYFPWNSGAILFEQLYELGIPVVVSCRGSQINTAPHNPDRLVFREGLQRTLAKTTLAHCVSQAIREEAVQLGLQPGKARVIRPAVDPHFFTPPVKKKSNERFLIISIGTLTWVKGYEQALISIRRLFDEGLDVEYHIIGDGPERQRVLYTIQDLGLQGHVILLGRLHHKK